MTKKLPPLPDDLPPGIAEYLNTVPPVTAQDILSLEAAGARLDSDPRFQANFLKSLFVEKMLQALDERGETKAGLAGILKKSRQYIQKLFNEAKQVNFTLETMCEVAHALGRRVHVFVCREDEEPVIVSRRKTLGAYQISKDSLVVSLPTANARHSPSFGPYENVGRLTLRLECPTFS